MLSVRPTDVISLDMFSAMESQSEYFQVAY